MTLAEHATCRKRRVVVVERILNHYRVPFYKQLHRLLDDVDIELQLLTGRGSQAEIKKNDEGTLHWAVPIPTHYMLGNRLCWQPFGRYLDGADMVVVMHENKLLYNLCLLLMNRRPKLAFWGHGRNMQAAKPNGMKERFKRWTLQKADWYFAYTELSAEIVRAAGFPNARITVVENAADTRRLSNWCTDVDESRRRALRSELGIDGGPVGLFLGSLYREKSLDFLLEAAARIRSAVPSFHLVVVGDGPDRLLIEKACEMNCWLHYLGPLHGKDKAEALMQADFMLNPGLVGLGILDSFVSGRPMFTTDCGLHSPEISYMVSGRNGLIAGNTVDDYVNSILKFICDPAALKTLQMGAQASASRYTVENMAARFSKGVLSCLGTKPGTEPICKSQKGFKDWRIRA